MSYVAAILTIYYSIRLLYLVFIDSFNGFKQVLVQHTKATSIEVLVLGFLGLLGLTSGYYFRDVFVGFGSSYFSASILFIPNN